MTPLSKAGKCFCIIYAVLGIPLTLMLLTALVERLMIPSTRFLRFLNRKLGHLCQPFNIRLLHLCVVGSLLLVFFWFLPAAIFAYLEPDWDYLDSMYYCFISLTTIGLGDYIPGDSPNQSHRPLYKILTTGNCFHWDVHRCGLLLFRFLFLIVLFFFFSYKICLRIIIFSNEGELIG